MVDLIFLDYIHLLPAMLLIKKFHHSKILQSKILYILCSIFFAVLSVFYKDINILILVSIFLTIIIDIKKQIIPNTIIVCNLLLFSIMIANKLIEFHHSTLYYIAFIIAIKPICDAIFKKEILGMGDVKLFITLFLFLPVHIVPFFLLLCGLFGILFILILKHKKVPFAPAICTAFLTVYFFQNIWHKVYNILLESATNLLLMIW